MRIVRVYFGSHSIEKLPDVGFKIQGCNVFNHQGSALRGSRNKDSGRIVHIYIYMYTGVFRGILGCES